MSGLIAAIATGTVAVAGSIQSFSQAGKAKKRQQKAEAEAKAAMADARKRLEVNAMEALSIKKEPYEQQVMAMLTQGQAGLQAGVEGDTRGAAATAGRTYMGQLANQERVRTAMGQELQDIERAKIAEEARLLDVGMGLDLQEVAGSQEAAANAEALRAASIQQGFEGLTQAASAAATAAPLYSGGGGGNALNPRSMGANKDMLTRRQRAPYLEAMEAYDASQRSLGQPVLQQSQFTPPPNQGAFQRYLQTGGAMPDPMQEYYNAFGGRIPTP